MDFRFRRVGVVVVGCCSCGRSVRGDESLRVESFMPACQVGGFCLFKSKEEATCAGPWGVRDVAVLLARPAHR